MIAQAIPHMAGNAIRLILAPPPTAEAWVVRRRSSNNFSGYADAGAVLVADGADDTVLDTTALVNGQPYYYAVFYRAGTAWWIGNIVEATPRATYEDVRADPETIVRDRLAAGLRVEVERDTLKPQSGEVRVLTAPHALPDDITFPCVSVHFDSEVPVQRFVGEDPGVGTGLGDGSDEEPFDDGEGWMARTTLNVVGVSLNGNERKTLRQAILRVLRANLGVFAELGLTEMEFSLNDSEDEAKNGVLFLTAGSLTCTHFARTRGIVPTVRDATATANPYGQEHT